MRFLTQRGFQGLLCLTLGGQVVSAAPSNRDDAFLAGSYGGINRIGMEGDTYALYTSHGFDWIWLQHKLVIPQMLAGQGNERLLVQVSKRTRILLRVLWWGNHRTLGDWQHELASFGIQPTTYGGEDLTGKDWIDLADDPALLEKAKRTVDWEIDTLEQRCGKGTLWAVTLSEEEPDVGMYFGRGMSWFSQHEAEAWPKIAQAHNALYDHVKKKYPYLQVGITFYPGSLKRTQEKLKYDLACIDPYPEKGQLEPILADCKEVYGVGDDVYILLWGCGSIRGGCCLKSYQEDTDWAETVFKAFRGAGYRNIGWFGLPYHANSFDRIMSWIDGQSPGTFEADGLAKEWRQATVRREETERILKALPAEVAAQAEPVSRKYAATLQGSRSDLRARLQQAAELRDSLVTETLNLAETTAQKLRATEALEASKTFLEAYGLSEPSQPPVTREQREKILYHCSAFDRLPDFFRLARPVLDQLHAATEALLKEVDTRLKRLSQQHPAADLGTARALFQELSGAWKRLDLESGRQMAQRLTDTLADAGVSSGVTLAVSLVNPYTFEVNAKPAIRISDDGQTWQEIYRAEPFHGDFRPVLSLPLPHPPRYAMVSNGDWTGDFGVDAVEITSGSRRKAMQVSRTAGVVREVELANQRDGKFARIAHVGGGYETDYIVFGLPRSDKR
jgi:hypothetical protein